MAASRLTVILLVFVLMGPLLGALVFGLVATLWLAVVEADLALMILPATLMFFPLSYLIGGFQALVTGIAAAVAAWRTGRLVWWPPLCVALAAGIVYMSRSHEDVAMSGLLLASHVGAAAGCLLILQQMFGRETPASRGRNLRQT